MNWHEIFIYKDGELIRKSSNNQHKHVGWVNSCGYLQCEGCRRNKATVRRICSQ